MAGSQLLSQFRNLFPDYPALEAREPLPPHQYPTAFIALVLGYALGPGPVQTSCITWLLLHLGLSRPCFTLGDTTLDYTTSSLFFVFWLWYVDHGVGRGGGPRYVGRLGRSLPERGVGRKDLKTWTEKLRWAVRLASSMRGVGWDWQVKNVPAHSDADIPRFRFVRDRVLEVLRRSVVKVLAVYTIGFCKTVQLSASSTLTILLLDAIVSWCGVLWSWHTIGVSYAAGAAMTVFLGLCEPWEWPPIFGSLRDTWSVRQVWSTTYHQLMRRTLQQPGIRLAHLLRLKKGTLGSRYVQLYAAFFISCSIHWWQSFSITRRDNGEYAFFMAQPVIITVEDFLRWIWRKSVDPRRKEKLTGLGYVVGYVWMVITFTVTLRPIMKGWTDIGLVGGGGLDEKAAMRLGRQHGAAYLAR
ncbi:hypothetical protein M426DRAFT_325421 [Hypoxylon sp. CI-4A]|nr:hypothetical protein M426DRAFT_325421 [Hypoxylon sp. CI-4A]